MPQKFFWAYHIGSRGDQQPSETTIDTMERGGNTPKNGASLQAEESFRKINIAAL